MGSIGSPNKLDQLFFISIKNFININNKIIKYMYKNAHTYRISSVQKNIHPIKNKKKKNIYSFINISHSSKIFKSNHPMFLKIKYLWY